MHKIARPITMEAGLSLASPETTATQNAERAKQPAITLEVPLVK